ncbi:MAG: hypothetical protein DRO65_00255 [Candidatus Altiarchaeales archaeon]|nr:MAG: hypothetical protein DRO65_00255 [Candidatus Altiarchaeales archaeon]
MSNKTAEVEKFEEELNSIIGICKERIEHHKAFLKEYEEIKGSPLELLKLNNSTKVKVISLIDALKRVKYRLYSLMEKEREYED